MTGEAPTSIVLGDVLARSLAVEVGDEITLTAPQSATGTHPHVFRVGGIFHADIEEYDRRLAYVDLAAQQAVLGEVEDITGIEIRVGDIERAPAIARHLETVLGSDLYHVLDWREQNRSLLNPPP